MPRNVTRAPIVAIALASGLLLTACSVTVTADEAPVEASAGVMGTAQATPDASQAAVIDDQYANFCKEEAEGALDMISLLGDDAATAISDGIAQSIAAQQMNPAQAEVCKQVWIDTMTANGVTYDDSGAAAPSASPAAS